MGKLYLIPTPIGNLQDITLRALQVLEQVDLILAEDTRTSGKLLQHFHISTPMLAHHKFNEHQALEGILRKLKDGQQLALISDAGTPAIADPGFLLSRACIAEGIPVETLPGATAFVPALVNSGLPNDRFDRWVDRLLIKHCTIWFINRIRELLDCLYLGATLRHLQEWNATGHKKRHHY